MIVMKFGGTLMGSSEAIGHSAGLVASSVKAGETVVVVPSAMSGVTDQLLKIALIAEGGEVSFANDEIALIRQRHLRTAQELGASSASATVEKLLSLLDALAQTVSGVALLHELSPRSKDLIVSFGERLSAPLMSLALEQKRVRALDLSGGQAGLVTSDHFGNARPLEAAYTRIPERLEGLFAQGITPVVTGFIGETEKGVITTLGRGGSDYTATILGAALNADEVWTWKDVDGVMTTDPRLVPEARNLEHLSYAEIMEMAYFGAKVLHPLAVTPLQDKGIPLRVKSAADPGFPGTLVTKDARGAGAVKAVSAIKNSAIIDIGGAGMVGVPEVMSRIFSVLAQENVSVLMISQGSSMASVSLVVMRPDAQRAFAALKRQFEGGEYVRTLELWEDVSTVAVVGEGMREKQGTAAKLFSAVAAEGISLHMISQGSSELNISFCIDETEMARAVAAVHKAFALERAEEVSGT